MRFKPLLGVMTECSHAPEPNKRLHSEKTPRFPNQTAYFNPYSEPIVSTQFTDVRDSNTGLNGFWILGQVLGFQSLSMEPLNYDYQWASGTPRAAFGISKPGNPDSTTTGARFHKQKFPGAKQFPQHLQTYYKATSRRAERAFLGPSSTTATNGRITCPWALWRPFFHFHFHRKPKTFHQLPYMS